MKYWFASLRLRALLAILCIFAGVLGIFGYRAYAEWQARYGEARLRVEHSANALADDQTELIQYAAGIVDTLVRTNRVHSLWSAGTCSPIFGEVLRDSPRFSNVVLVLADGEVACNAASPGARISVADRPELRRALMSQDLQIGEAARSPTNGKFVLPIGRAVVAPDGTVEGLVIVSLDLSWVSRELAKGHFPEGSRIGIVDANGTVLAHFPDGDLREGKNVADTPRFKALLARDGLGSFESTGDDGKPYVYGISRFADTMVGSLYVWVGIPRATLIASLWGEFTVPLAATLLLLVASCIVVIVSNDRLFLRPVLSISRAAQRLAGGDRSARTGVVHNNNEFGRLAASFDVMANTLEAERRQIARSQRALQVLSSWSRTLVEHRDEALLTEGMCRAIVEAGRYPMARVDFVSPSTDRSMQPLVVKRSPPGVQSVVQDPAQAVDISGQALTEAILPGVPVVLHRAQAVEGNAAAAIATTSSVWHTAICLPLHMNGAVIGALTVGASEADAFAPDETLLLQQVASELSWAMELRRAREHRDALAKSLALASAREADAARKFETSVRQSLEEGVQAIAAVVEARDAYTAGHSQRVAALASALATKLGLNPDTVKGIHLAGILHDIGKVNVPIEVLNKRGPLTLHERQLIQSHVEVGFEILKRVSFPWPIATMVHQHHERLDGSGYPHGLTRDAHPAGIANHRSCRRGRGNDDGASLSTGIGPRRGIG